MEEEEWSKLSISDRVSHKVWKARLDGYDELNKKIPIMDVEELKSYCDVVKKAPFESNAAALDRALECVLSFLQNAPELSERIVVECVCGVVTKVLSARPKSKQLGFDVCLQFIENEVASSVVEELLKVVTNKNPKIVNGSSELILLAIKEFGAKVIDIKPVVKTIPKFLSHNDKNVRNNAKAIALECYYYLGDAIKNVLADIQPVQMKELEEEFSKLKGQAPPIPPRKIRSQQQQQQKAVNASNGETTVNDDANQEEPQDIMDPYDLLDPVDILSSIPDDFYTKITEAKWQSRKEALESVIKLIQSPKITPGNFSNFIGALKKVISSDVNVNVCLLAINSVGFLAKGLKSDFEQYCSTIAPTLLDRFKEKKPNIVAAIRDAVDACSSSWSLENVIAIVTPYYDHKVPSIREECIKYLGRYLSRKKPSTISKPIIKSITTDLVKRMDDNVGPVREATAEAFAILMKISGEKVLNALLEGQIDDIKKNKIKSIYLKMTDSAESSPNAPSAIQPISSSSCSKPSSSSISQPSASAIINKASTSKTTSAPSNKPIATQKTPPKNAYENDSDEPAEPDIEEDSAIEQSMGTLLNEELVKSLGSSVWKDRLECVETIKNKISLEPLSYNPPVVFKVLSKKPGWRDGNLQVFKAKLSVMSQLVVSSKTAEKPFSRRAAHNLIPIIADKIGDVKMKDSIRNILIELADALSLNYVSIRLANILQSTKNVKVQCEILNWISDMLYDFGLKIDVKPHIHMLKFALDQINPEVKKCAVHLAVRMHVHMGATLMRLLADVKPVQLTQIENEYSRVKSEPIPKPIRGVEAKTPDDTTTATPAVNATTNKISDTVQQQFTMMNLEDSIERVDVSDLISDEILTNLEDKNWKIRTESLEKINDIFKTRKPVQHTGRLSSLITTIVSRLQDNNKNIVVLTLNICSAMIDSVGPNIYEHKNTLFRGILSCLMDSKPNVHNAALSTLDSWNSIIPIHMTLNIDSLVVSELLLIEHPNLRAGVLTYLIQSFEKMPDAQVPPQCIELLIQPTFQCLTDRKNEVRKVAQEFIPFVVKFYNPNNVRKMANSLDRTMQNIVIPIIEQAVQNSKSTISKTFHPEVVPVAKPQETMTTLHDNNKNVEFKEVDKVHFEEVEMEEDTKPVVMPPKPQRLKHVVGSKKVRERDDSINRIIQWNFGSLKPAYISHLKELMTPYIEPELLDQLFHTDFKNHIIAAKTLSEICLNGNEVEREAYFECFDLILKWCVIKFFEINPVVHVKALELLQISLQEFQKGDRFLCDYEVNSFVNYLCIKFGDPRENVRKLAHQVFHLLVPLYDSAKLLCCLMFGLSHKLMRVKADSLFEMTSLLENDNIDKFVEVLGQVSSEVAKFVVDRDVNIKKNAIQFFSQIYLSIGPNSVDYIKKCEKTIRDIIVEKFNKLHPQYLALKQSQLSLLEEQDVNFQNTAHDDSIITESHYNESLDNNETRVMASDIYDVNSSPINSTAVDVHSSMQISTIPQRYSIDKDVYFQAAKDVRPPPRPNLIAIDEALLYNEPSRAELTPNLEYDYHRYSIENDYVENFLRVESVFHSLKRDNIICNSIGEELLKYFSCMNNDIIIVLDDMDALENIIEDYYTRNLWLWIDALDLFNHLVGTIDIDNYTDIQHGINHNYIETCLYQLNIVIHNSKFGSAFTAEIQSKLFSFLMDLIAHETFNKIFKVGRVIEIMSSVTAQLLVCTPIIQSLSVIQELIQCHVDNVKKIEFLLRLFWKCSQVVVTEIKFYQDNELDKFVSAYYLIYSIIMETSNNNNKNNSDYFVLLDHCFSSVMKQLSKNALYELYSINNDLQMRSHIENTIKRLGIQLPADTDLHAVCIDREMWITTLENKVADYIDYKNSIEKLVRYRLHEVDCSGHHRNKLHHITNLIKWRTSLDNLTKSHARQHIINGKILQDKYEVDFSSSSSTTLINTPSQPARKYISQLLDNNNSGLNLSNMTFASPAASSLPPSPGVTSSNNKSAGSNLANLKARLEKIKADNI